MVSELQPPLGAHGCYNGVLLAAGTARRGNAWVKCEGDVHHTALAAAASAVQSSESSQGAVHVLSCAYSHLCAQGMDGMNLPLHPWQILCPGLTWLPKSPLPHLPV